MRRGSIVGPLLLIGIGALFLARNVIPDLPLLDYLAQYWPYLLILWGAVRLIEIAIWATRGAALPRVGLSGGEWVLVIFLCMFGFSLHAVRGFSTWLPVDVRDFASWQIYGQSYEYPVQAEASSPANPRVVIEDLVGTARIVGGDTDKVTVTGHQTIRSMDQATADRAGKDARVEVSHDGNTITIRHVGTTRANEVFVGRRRGPTDGRIRADLDIVLPKGATIVATNRRGDLDISAITGAVDVKSNNGSVRLENIGGSVRIETNSSDLIRAVNVKGNLDLKGSGNDVDIEKVSGQVTVAGSWSGLSQLRELAQPVHWDGAQTDFTAQGLPGEIRLSIGDLSASRVLGPFRIESSNKDVTLMDINGSTSVTLQRGDVRITAANVPVADTSVRIEGGRVELALPEKARFNLNAVAERGEAYNDYGDAVRQENDGRRSSLRASGGGPSIDVHVQRGDVTIRSAGSNATAALPALPAEKPLPNLPPLPRTSPKNAPPKSVEQ